jgi:hypothetical protein
VDGVPSLSTVVLSTGRGQDLTPAEQGLAVELVRRLESEHDEIAGLIEKFNAALCNFADVEPASVATNLQRLADELRAHPRIQMASDTGSFEC